MPQLSRVADSFLDGFGCLGAMFEPAVRPGSMDNLIQEDYPTHVPSASAVKPSKTEPGLYGSVGAFARHALVGTAIIALVLGFLHQLGWLPNFFEGFAIGFATLLASEGRTLMIRWRRAGSRVEKAVHGL